MFPDDDSGTPEELDDEIPVVICAAAGRMGAAMAAINSIYSNTDANILFYVVGLRNTLSRIQQVVYRRWEFSTSFWSSLFFLKWVSFFFFLLRNVIQIKKGMTSGLFGDLINVLPHEGISSKASLIR